MAKTGADWAARPKFPATHFVDSRIYTDEAIFEEEQEKIFSKSWIIACHESELPSAFDYRPFTHPAGVPLIVVRGEDMKVRSFYNICPHRGNTLLYDPVGNAKRITCIFHAWSFDTKGDCVDITRGEQGYQERFVQAGRRPARGADRDRLRRLRLGQPRRRRAARCAEYIGDALDMLEPHMQEPLEVFHYPQGASSTPTTSCGTTRTASSITTTCTTSIASPA